MGYPSLKWPRISSGPFVFGEPPKRPYRPRKGWFNKAYYPKLDDLARRQIFFGGSGSGKSVFMAQRVVYDLLNGGRNYLVCRQVGRTLRGSVYNEILRVITSWNVESRFMVNKTDMTITCDNKYQALLVGLDDVEKLKSLVPIRGVITDVWIEEATETEQDTIRQLFKRQRGGDYRTKKRLVMTFNPIVQSHWIYKEYFSRIAWADDQTEYWSPELSIMKTWYIHNAFLTEDDVKDLLDETDPYYRSVYTFGNWGVLGNVIFSNYRVEDISWMTDLFVNRRHGLDFGFSSDPAAMPCTHYDRMKKTIYIYAELYERGLTNDLLAGEVKNLIGKDYVACDSAEPKSITELQRYGVNATPAVKGKDSILHGIQWIQQQTIVIDVSCINTRNEFQQYKWKEDKDGNVMRVPVDRFNHIIDGLRYAYERESGGTLDVY